MGVDIKYILNPSVGVLPPLINLYLLHIFIIYHTITIYYGNEPFWSSETAVIVETTGCQIYGMKLWMKMVN